MKKLTKFFGFLLLSFLTVTATQAQDASLDDILSTYFENIGGEDNWKKVKSIKMSGNFSMQGMEMPTTVYVMEPAYQKSETDFQGKQFVRAYDGETAWMINPFMGGPDPQKLSEEETRQMSKQKFQDEFIDYEKKGHKVELVGTEEVDGAEAYKIKMIKKDGDIVFYYFDMDNYVPIMVKALIDFGPQKGQAMEMYMSDYQEVDGLMMAHTTEQKVNGAVVFSMTMDKIELNPEGIEASMFAFPEKEEKEEK
ncbi:MAG: outer membrane lipoprotein-sorting protein [Bacteroidota bacterium]